MVEENPNFSQLSVFSEPGYIVFQIGAILLKLPAEGTMEEIYNTTKKFVEDLFSVKGVAEVIERHKVIISKVDL